jgi:hypothetical protein
LPPESQTFPIFGVKNPYQAKNFFADMSAKKFRLVGISYPENFFSGLHRKRIDKPKAGYKKKIEDPL